MMEQEKSNVVSKRLSVYEITVKDDGSALVTTDISPEEMKILLTVGLLTCLQQGVMLIGLAEKLGIVVSDTEVKESEVIKEITPENWESLLNSEGNTNAS